MSPVRVIAVDIGSSSARVALRDAIGEPAGPVAQVRYAMDTDDGGGVSIELDRLFEVLAEAVDTFVAACGEDDLAGVAGVGISCFLHSMAALDATGRPITPLLTWADTTSARQATELRERLAEDELWQATGCPLHASYWPAKVLRLAALTGGPPLRVAGAPTLIFERLTGVRAIDLSEASGTGFLDRAAATWHRPLLEAVGLPVEAMPPIAAPFASARLAGRAAERWPTLAAIPWFVPWSDAWCGNLGLGRTAGRGAALQVGTSGAIRVVLDDPLPTVPPGLFGHRLPDGTALVGGQLSEGGGVAAAVARLVGSTPDALEAAARRLPPDGHRLTVLPYLAGERGPGYHADARGVIAGVSLDTSSAEVYLATLEAVALRFAALEARLATVAGADRDDGLPLEIVAAGGALTASPLWRQIVAAALGRSIALSDEDEASTRGAALLALTGLGAIASPAAAPPPPSVPVEPEPARVVAYRAALERQEALYRRHLGR